MKKILFSLIAVMVALGTNAQVAKVYENGVLSKTYTNSLSHKHKVVFEERPDAKNLLPGKFSVSATKKVQFTKSNLYWDGSAYHFEANQTDYPTTWSTSHVGHFYWTNYYDYRSGTAAYMPYAESYSYSSQSSSDTFWCGKDYPLTVEGSHGLYALTGSSSEDEWYYLLKTRTNASNLCKCGVTVTNGGISYTNCLIIAPDDYDYTTTPLASNYTLDEVNSLGLVCLPAAGYRADSSFREFGSRGSYWSASPAYISSQASYINSSDNISLNISTDRNRGHSIRLVKTVDISPMSTDVQVVKVYDNGSLVDTYTNSSSNTVEVVFEEKPALSHEYVEIGGLKWATMNLGATTVAGSPSTCYGDYYAWGETEPRYTSITIYSKNSVSSAGWKSDHSSGYSSSDYPSYTGTTLDEEHDAATQNWGSDWRTPTQADFEALANACTGSTNSVTPSTLSSSSPTGGIYWLSSSQTYLSDYSGVAGILFVDATDTSKRVFFPAAGYCQNYNFTSSGSFGFYWSSSLHTGNAGCAKELYFDSSSVVPSRLWDARYCGLSVRPVSE